MSIRLIKDEIDEMKCEINLCFTCTCGHGRYLVDSQITPGYCTNCNRQITGFFKYSGSRYGQVGEIGCDHCYEWVYCTDDDNVKHGIVMSTKEAQFSNHYKNTVIEFDKLYLLTHDIFQKVKEKAGYDVCIKNEDITLRQIINNIQRDQKIDNLEPYNGNLFDSRFVVLPGIVRTWFSLLRHLQII